MIVHANFDLIDLGMDVCCSQSETGEVRPEVEEIIGLDHMGSRAPHAIVEDGDRIRRARESVRRADRGRRLDDGLLLRKYLFSVSEEEQLRRFKARRNDPVRQWKLSPMDMESLYRWEDYSRAKDEMMVHTDTPVSPWYVVESDIKKHARLNMMHHLLSTIDYTDVETPKVKLPGRPVVTGNYQRPPRELSRYVDDYAATLIEG